MRGGLIRRFADLYGSQRISTRKHRGTRYNIKILFILQIYLQYRGLPQVSVHLSVIPLWNLPTVGCFAYLTIYLFMSRVALWRLIRHSKFLKTFKDYFYMGDFFIGGLCVPLNYFEWTLRGVVSPGDFFK